MFRLVKSGNLWYYTIDAFEETGILKHCFTTRHGGVSNNEFKSMNLRINCDDTRENVMENYSIICRELGIDINSLVLSKQVHEVNIADVGREDCGNGLIKPNRFDSADALVTAQRGVTLVTFYADCVPVYLLDKRQGVVALIHSGWKGTIGRICELTAEHMCKIYGSDKEDILAAIGPSIRACHFEVGDEVAELFDDRFIAKGYKKPHIDLQGCIASQLVDCGIPKANITDSGICTYCNDDLFYSHRKVGTRRGTMAAFAQLV